MGIVIRDQEKKPEPSSDSAKEPRRPGTPVKESERPSIPKRKPEPPGTPGEKSPETLGDRTSPESSRPEESRRPQRIRRSSIRRKKRRARKHVVIAQASLFIPFVLGVLLTVDRSAPARSCVAKDQYSALMARLAPDDGQWTIIRLGASALQTVAPLLIMFVGFIALCCILQLPTFAYIGLRKGSPDRLLVEALRAVIVLVTPVSLVLAFQHADVIPALQGCELPALTTSWFPWSPAPWFRTGMSWVLFIVSTLLLTLAASIVAFMFSAPGPLLVGTGEDFD